MSIKSLAGQADSQGYLQLSWDKASITVMNNKGLGIGPR